jgi:hypothetical protein
MGVTMGFMTKDGTEPPFWFTRTDGKQLWGFIVDHHSYSDGPLHILLDNLGLHMNPFWTYSGEEYSRDVWMSLNLPSNEDEESQEKAWHEHIAQIESSYQSPETLIECIQPILKAIDKEPDIFKDLNINESYFTKGYFKQDLIDLKKILDWTIENGHSLIRLAVR